MPGIKKSAIKKIIFDYEAHFFYCGKFPTPWQAIKKILDPAMKGIDLKDQTALLEFISKDLRWRYV